MRRRTFHRIASGGLLACVVALLSALALPALAQTAPQYQDSEPNAGASVQSAPDHVSVTFNEPLDDSSTMSVVNACGDNVDNGTVTVELNEMSIGLDEAHYSGTYKVSYTAVGVGGVTGTTSGSFRFDAAEGHSCEEPKHEHEHKNDDDGHKGHEKDHDKGHMRHDKDGHGEHGSTGHSDHVDGMGHSDHSINGSGHGTHEMEQGESHSHSEGTHHGQEGHGDNRDGDHAEHGAPGGSQASDVLPALPADGQAVLIALALCAVMGVIGGLFLRAGTH